MLSFVIRIASLSGALALAAAAAQAQPLTSVGKGEGAVDIVAWPGYIERGETDKALRLGHRVRAARPAARSASRPPAPRTRWWR